MRKGAGLACVAAGGVLLASLAAYGQGQVRLPPLAGVCWPPSAGRAHPGSSGPGSALAA